MTLKEAHIADLADLQSTCEKYAANWERMADVATLQVLRTQGLTYAGQWSDKALGYFNQIQALKAV